MMALTIILGYALMIWIMSLIIGIWSLDDKMDEFEWCMAALWPLGLLVLLPIGLGQLLEWMWYNIPCMFREKIASVAKALCVVFNPFKIGTMIRGWIQRKKDEKILKKEGEGEEE